jgi:hypothetical protein
MALITADNSTSLGRPPGFAAGSSSLKNSYCSMLRSLGYDLLISLSRCCIGFVFTAYSQRAFLRLFHLFKQPLIDLPAVSRDRRKQKLFGFWSFPVVLVQLQGDLCLPQILIRANMVLLFWH